jgi:hypothetical protein
VSIFLLVHWGINPTFWQTLPDEMRSIFRFYHQVASANPDLTEFASPADVADALGQEAGELESERDKVSERIAELRSEISSIWDAEKEAEYELVSVFMHRGEASFGHYYVSCLVSSEYVTRKRR